MRQTRAMAVAQKPIAGAIFGQSSPGAGWKMSIIVALRRAR
jgi:hypothetical protein